MEWETVGGDRPTASAGLDAPTPVEVEKKLIGLAETLSEALMEWKRTYRAYKDAERAFDEAHAKARLAAADASIAPNDRKSYADLHSMEQRKAFDMAEVVYKYADKRLDAINKAISIWQSVSKSVQQAYAIYGRGET